MLVAVEVTELAPVEESVLAAVELTEVEKSVLASVVCNICSSIHDK